MLRERQRQRLDRQIHGPNTDHQSNSNLSLWVTGIVWLAFAAGLAWSFYSSQSSNLRIFSAIGLIWSGLWTRFLSIDYGMPRLAEFSLLSALAGFMGLLTVATLQMGYPLSITGGLLAFIAASLCVSIINRSNIALMSALGAALLWAGLQMDGFLETGANGLALPALLALAILQATRLKSGLAIIAGLCVGYLWLIGGAYTAFSTKTLSPLYLACGAAVIGAVHCRASKAAEDEGLQHTHWHVTTGWLVSNTGLLCLALFALDPADPLWANSQDISPTVRIIWLALMATAVTIHFAASLVRRRHKHMNIAGSTLSALLLAALPFAIWFLPQLETQFEAFTGTTLYPMAGLFLFGVITGHVVFFISNAFRRSNFIQFTTALIMLGGVAYVSSNVDLLFQDNWVPWVLGTILSCLVTLIMVEPQLATLEDPNSRTHVSSS